MNDIKTWQERMREADAPAGYRHIEHQYIQAEIAELRAALAARATPAQPVPTNGNTDKMREAYHAWAAKYKPQNDFATWQAAWKSCESAPSTKAIAVPVEAYAAEDGVEHSHPNYGRGVFFTFNCAKELYEHPVPPPAQPASAVAEAIRKLPLPETSKMFGHGYTSSDMRAVLSEAAALAEQRRPFSPTQQQFQEWCERHDMRADRGDVREAFDDAASLYLTAPSITQDGQKSEADRG